MGCVTFWAAAASRPSRARIIWPRVTAAAAAVAVAAVLDVDDVDVDDVDATAAGNDVVDVVVELFDAVDKSPTTNLSSVEVRVNGALVVVAVVVGSLDVVDVVVVDSFDDLTATTS